MKKVLLEELRKDMSEEAPIIFSATMLSLFAITIATAMVLTFFGFGKEEVKYIASYTIFIIGAFVPYTIIRLISIALINFYKELKKKLQEKRQQEC